MSFCDEISDVIVVSSQYNNYDQPTYATLTPMKPSQLIFNEISSTSSVESQNSSSQQLTPNNLNMNYTNEEMEEDEPENDFNERNSGQNGEPCLVCGGIAKGLHFQVNSCRACAAFFRRSTKSKLVYRCQRGTGRCDLTVKVKGKPLCRYCRMKKCTSVGMRIESENIPSLESNNSGSISSSPTEPSPLENWNKNFGRSEVRIEGKRVIYDSQPLVSVIKESLRQNRSNMGNLPSGITLTPMQKMNAAVTKFMTSLTPKIGEIQVVTEIGVDCGMKFLEEYLLKLTEMVTSCNYFTSLPDSDKWPIFKRFWSTFHQIERAYQTIQVFGNEINDYRILIDNKKAVDMDVAKLKIMEFNTEIGNILKIFEPIKDRVFQHLLNPMKQLRPTNYELAYMTQHVLWSCFEINGLLPSTYRIAEEVTERNANELHNYYVYEMHISNYASRHAALLKLVAVSDFIIRSKKDMMIMAKVFDILENDFFESELMQ